MSEDVYQKAKADYQKAKADYQKIEVDYQKAKADYQRTELFYRQERLKWFKSQFTNKEFVLEQLKNIGYKDVQFIAKGSSGMVWKVFRLGEVVAVKVEILAPLGNGNRQSIDSEIAILKALEKNCAHFLCLKRVKEIPIKDEGEAIGKIILIETEYLDGMKPLAEFLKNTRLSEQAKLTIITNLVRIVKSLHEFGIVHLDIKPANIMIAEDLTLKLIDFGFSCEEQNERSCIGGLRGTPNFIAPELWEMEVETFKDAVKADYWALGVVIFMVKNEGRIPFNSASAEGLKKLVLEYNDQFAEESMGLLLKDPNQRVLPN